MQQDRSKKSEIYKGEVLKNVGSARFPWTIVRKQPKSPKWEKSQILICDWLYSTDAGLYADLGNKIIFLHLLFIHFYYISQESLMLIIVYIYIYVLSEA